MIDNNLISLVVKRLVDVYHPLAIYLFGSYAWGRPTEHSDLDVMIVVDGSDEPSYRRSVKGYHALFGLNIDAEIMVRTKYEFDSTKTDITTLAHKIDCEGKIVYAKP